MVRKYFLPLFTVGLVCGILGFLQGARASTDLLNDLIKSEISKQYPGARIDLTSSIRWIQGGLPVAAKNVSIVSDFARGEVQFSVSHSVGQSVGLVNFSAWMPAWIALRRIHPGEKLNPDLFVTQDVNVAMGQAREFRGVIYTPSAQGSSNALSSLEARQTVLEGQFLTSTAIIRTPDIRRGDSVRIRMIAGDMILSTLGIAEEPGYLNNTVRVMTNRTKRELVGQLMAGGFVEVKL